MQADETPSLSLFSTIMVASSVSIYDWRFAKSTSLVGIGNFVLSTVFTPKCNFRWRYIALGNMDFYQYSGSPEIPLSGND